MQNVQDNSAGFTLIEMLVALAIIAILATFTYSSYSQFIYKARRTNAQQVLFEIAIAQEKHFQQNAIYNKNLLNLPLLQSTQSSLSGSFYKISATITTVQSAGFDGFTLTAIAIDAQSKDKDCLKLTVNHLNDRKSFNLFGDATHNCWY